MFSEGQGAIVTGGNRGIGEAIVHALAARGMKVMIAALGTRENEAVAVAVKREYGVRVETMDVDLTEEENCRRLIDRAKSRFGAVHLLVNNAGMWSKGKVFKTESKEFDKVMKTNLYSAFWCSRSAYAVMLENVPSPESGLRGAILSISSRCGIDGMPGVGVYSASKHAVMGLTRAMADEGAQDLIRVVAICPSLVSTPTNRVSGPRFLQRSDITDTVSYLLDLSPAAWPREVVIGRRTSGQACRGVQAGEVSSGT